jgi:hypothetical protein
MLRLGSEPGQRKDQDSSRRCVFVPDHGSAYFTSFDLLK